MKKKMSLLLALILVFSAVSASAATLKMNSKGEQVKKLQTRLKELGYFMDTIDGKYGYSTWSAVWWYQKNNGLKVDGIAGPQTLSSIGLASGKVDAGKGLKMGDSGAAVTALQHALKALGYYSGEADGTYGFGTWEAVWKFQRDAGMHADGVASATTLVKLSMTSGSGYTPSFSGTRNVKYGERSGIVRALQRALKAKGYYNLEVDGQYGFATWEAVWKFERDNGLQATGVAGPRVLAMLGITPDSGTSTSLPKGKTVKMSASGQHVRDIQTALKNLGLYNQDIDGKYGYGTWSAVWYFQRDNGIHATGNVDSKTWNLLLK